MPVQYSSVLQEHKAVRNSSGVFDVTHLGRFELTGSGAKPVVRRLLCNDILRVEPGRAQYTMMLNEAGGVIDDLLVWWWEEGMFWILPNAANHQRVMDAFARQRDCDVQDLQRSTVMIAVQGPDAPGIIEAVVGEKPGRLRLARDRFDGGEVHMAGTGYTGEPGGELCTDPENGHALVETLLAAGVTPCGLGARDTLRLEAGLPLWGEDLDETTTPLEAGLDFAVSLDHEFVGRDALLRQAEDGVTRLLTGFVLEERKIPRNGHEVRTRTGSGEVTSGNLSPMLEKGVGLAYISPPPDADAIDIEVEIRGKWIPGRITKPPFHKD